MSSAPCHPGGDHYIAVGRVLSLAAAPAKATAAASAAEPSPLIFFRSHYWVAGPHPADG